MVDTKAGSIFYSAPLIPNYAGTQFKKTLEEKFHIPCEVENDVNCAGLAESISGAAKDCDIVLCLTVGTGIGGCIVMDKKVYHGFSNSACEVGYLPMLDSDFQTLGSTKTLCERVAVAKAKEGDKSKWGGRRIFEAAQKGDWVCLREIDRMTEALGRGIATICYVVNPEIVVLGGGVMAQKDYLYPKIRKAMDTYLVSGISEKTKVRMASYENHAGMIGAFYHFKTLHPGEGGECVWKAT
jgi:predicted NBD/HSP70 family sugar kinase